MAVQATGGDAVQGGAAGARQPLEGVRVAALGPAHETRQRSTVQGFRGHGCSLSLLRETRYPVRPLDASAPAQCDRPYGKLRASYVFFSDCSCGGGSTIRIRSISIGCYSNRFEISISNASAILYSVSKDGLARPLSMRLS